MDPFGDLFNFGRNRNRGERKGQDLSFKLYVDLADLYNGSDVQLFLTKRTTCPHCRGTGADDPDDVKECPKCKGKGIVLEK